MGAKAAKTEMRNLAVNRQAPHFYHLLERFEAGIELTGTEVKSIRDGKSNLKDGYCVVKDGQIWLIDSHISPYTAGSYMNHDPLRNRRLLLRSGEIDKLAGKTIEKGLTLVPLRFYLKQNLIKCEIALAKGKKVYDRRDASRQRTIDREAKQAISEHRKRSR
jgi:SsrA-binding protein